MTTDLFSSRVMVYRTACRYEYDVTLMSMTSSITAARFLLRPTVALVDRDYQILHAPLSQQQNYTGTW